MKVRAEKGFTLIEVIVATVILVAGIGIIGSIITGITRKNFFSYRHTQAVILAQNKIEELLNEGYNSDNLLEGEYENSLNPVDATGEDSGDLNQFWSIYDVRPIDRSKQIFSTVQWLDGDGELRTVELTAICIDEGN